MVLVVDVGNTRVKYAVYQEYKIIENFNCSKDILQNNILLCLTKFSNIQHIVVASVTHIAQDDFRFLPNFLKLHIISINDDFPFKNLYKTPTTLGIDRLVLVTGAVIRFPQKNRLIIDAGTCITYDYVDQNDNYLGGGISPGIRLRYNALHQYTDKLPQLNTHMPESIIGTSTNDAIHSGVVNGIIFEIDEFINQYTALNPNIIIILTGGDAEFLAKRLKNTIFADSNFLLESLNYKFHYKI